MEISPVNFVRLIAASIIFGAFMGGFNDLQGFIRALLFFNKSDKNTDENIQKRKMAKIITDKALSIVIFLQDIAFFTVFGVGIVIINYYFNNGRFRIYAPIAAFSGFLVYYFSLGIILRKIQNLIAVAIRRLILLVLTIFLKPIMLFFTFFGKNVKKLGIKVFKTIAKTQKKVYNNNKVKQVMKKASFGFVEPLKSSIRGRENDQ